MRYRDLSLRTKQKIGLGIILLFMACANIFTIYEMATIKEEIDEVTNNWLPRAIAISNLNLNTSKLRISQLEQAYTFDETEMNERINEMMTIIDDINNNIDTYDTLKSESEKKGLYSAKEGSLYETFDENWTLYLDLSTTINQKLLPQNKRDETAELLINEGKEIANNGGYVLEELVKVNEKDAYKAASRASATFNGARYFTIIVLIVTIILSILITGRLFRLITEPIAKLERAAGEVSKGDLEVHLKVESEDEIGSLTSSFIKMTESLNESRKKLLSQQYQLLDINVELKKNSESLELQKNEIEKKNLKLEETMKKLTETQNQLVQSEKMASLGQLTAGIAHEINNPINFVIANVNPLRKDISDLLKIVDTYDTSINEKDLKESFKEIEQIKDEFEFEYLLDEINNLLNGIEEGGIRTSGIVKGLRNFSRLDEDEKKHADIHSCLDSTLLMLHNEFKNKIEVVKDYTKMDEVLCYPGKLNQVFMNILSNAGQAIEKNGEIYIKTWEKDNYVNISIKDTGRGMKEEVKHRIFEPFYTTKEVGQGTGLGLSISFGIIKDHKGDIKVNSIINEGTEFTISIPAER
ncbi:ATP-binding protein [Bacteroidota bacterium]